MAGDTFPRMSVRSLGYVRLATPDIEAWRRFAGDFLGLMPVERDTDEDAESIAFRMDDYAARLVVSTGPEPAAEALGLEVTDRRALAAITESLAAEGYAVTVGTDAECADRAVTGMVRVDDPSGNTIELYYGPRLAHDPVQTPMVSGFVTGDMGLGHVIVTADDLDESFDFYTRLLGFAERNTMGHGRVVFMGCNPRHHTLGITARKGPGALLHLMVEVATLDDVGRAVDRAHRMDVPMMHSLGRHTNDRMVSFYVYSPENYAVEFGYDGLRIEGTPPTYEITAGAFWGHRFTPPPAPAKESASESAGES